MGRNQTGRALDYDLVDILRALSRHDRDCVIPRLWLATALDLWTYHGGGYDAQALRLMFPELTVEEAEKTPLILGERLLERSAVVHQFESGLFVRVVDAGIPVVIAPELHLWHGPPSFQASNSDLEIRCDEAGPYEVVSFEEGLVAHLKDSFRVTEVE